jgi:hypothetical protein
MSRVDLIEKLIVQHGHGLRDVLKLYLMEYTAIARSDVKLQMSIVFKELDWCIDGQSLIGTHCSIRLQRKNARLMRYSCRRMGITVPWRRWNSDVCVWMELSAVPMDAYHAVVWRLNYTFSVLSFFSHQLYTPSKCADIDDPFRTTRIALARARQHLESVEQAQRDMERRLRNLENDDIFRRGQADVERRLRNLENDDIFRVSPHLPRNTSNKHTIITHTTTYQKQSRFIDHNPYQVLSTLD